MTRIESKHVTIDASVGTVETFLLDMHNFEQLLPEGRISEWTSDGKSCSFKVQGAATIGLQLDGNEPGKMVRMKSTERSPFPFTLNAVLEADGDRTKAHQVFEADLNPVLKMMVSGPLKNLFDHIADKMVAVHARS